jgi:hypothetical protein
VASHTLGINEVKFIFGSKMTYGISACCDFLSDCNISHTIFQRNLLIDVGNNVLT